MDVTIDGTRYTPADETAPRIGISITTHDRPKVLTRALEHQREHLPPGAVLVVVDDGSKTPVPDADHRFTPSRGIVAAKNKALELLMAAGVEHLFLFDDDAWPTDPDWWKPYIASPEPHLAYQFHDLSGPRKLGDLGEIYRDDEHVAYTGQRGVMLYYHRTAIEAVGGFDPVYGRGMYEHSDLALRIHHAGWTTWAFADVVGSEKLIHSLDEHEKVDRTIPDPERRKLAARNVEIHNTRRDSGHTGYVEYREPLDVVITSLLTSQPDPQRGTKMRPNAAPLTAWARSITGARRIVLADELDKAPDGAHLERVAASKVDPYHARWLHLYRHLRDHPEYRWVFATDGTDVTMLRPPWDAMAPDTLYIGYEPQVVGCRWLRTNHKAKAIADFIDADPGRMLLNAGVVGGDRATVLEFAHHMVRLYFDNAAQRFWTKETHPLGFDMGTANLVAYTYFAGRIETGPRVTTVFKANQDATSSPALWAHK